MDIANPKSQRSIDSSSLIEGVREQMFPALVATGVVICLIQTASETPLPQIFGAAAFLFLAVFNDVQRQRIPNWLTFPALGIALGLALLGQVETGGGAALAGSALALVVFGIPFACGWLGAGDVKGCMVLGALWGPVALIGTAWWMVVSGGVLAIVIVALQRGGLKDLLRRWSLSAWYSLRTRRVVYLTPDPNGVAAGGLPFAVAMGSGASAFQLWGTPWL
jgi:prepilin peptidase CpaA